jgi:hypothetical protein
MPTATAIVPADIASQALVLINNKQAAQVQAGVELILKNNLVISPDVEISASAGQRDVSNLLKEGLDLLGNKPFDALNIPVGSKTVDIRKAYKKLALK